MHHRQDRITGSARTGSSISGLLLAAFYPLTPEHDRSGAGPRSHGGIEAGIPSKGAGVWFPGPPLVPPPLLGWPVPWIPSPSAVPASTTSRTSTSRSPATSWWSSPASRAPASRRWPSTPSSPRGSGATSSRSPSYARQFLEQMEKPDVDSIEGLSPAISIEQKSVSQEPALDGGHGHRDPRLPAAALRLGRRARTARTAAQTIRPQTVQQMVDRVAGAARGDPARHLRPLRPRQEGGVQEAAAADGDAKASCAPASTARWSSSPASRPRSTSRRSTRSTSSSTASWSSRASRSASPTRIETALKVAGGPGGPRARRAPPRRRSPRTTPARSAARASTEITPRLFSFNSPYGACPTCSGLGTLMGVDAEKVVPDPERSILAGAVAPWPEGSKSWRLKMVDTLVEGDGVLALDPWKKLPAEAQAR